MSGSTQGATFIPAWLDDLGLDPYEFRVYCHIARRGECWESLPNMAETLKMNLRTLKKTITSLHTCGLLNRQDRGGKTSVFTVNADAKKVVKPHADLHPVQNCTPCKIAPPPRADLHGVPRADLHPKGTPLEGTPFKEDDADKRAQEDKNLEKEDFVSLIAVYDEVIADVYPPNLARSWPDQSDAMTAHSWQALGCTAKTVRLVVLPILQRRLAQGHGPPTALKYFSNPIKEALKAQEDKIHGNDETKQTREHERDERIKRLIALQLERERLKNQWRDAERDDAAVLPAVSGGWG